MTYLLPYLLPKTVDALKAVREAIAIDHGDSFGMDSWALRRPEDCGTVCCLAGHLALAAGYTPWWGNRNAGDEQWGTTNLFSSEEKRGASERPYTGYPYGGRYPFTIEQVLAIEYDLNLLVAGSWDLFYLNKWPEDLQAMFTRDPVGAAQLAIDWYIEKYTKKPDSPDSPDSPETKTETETELVFAGADENYA